MQLPKRFQEKGSILVVSFQGWNDAGDAASQAVAMLRESTTILEQDEINDEQYFDYQFIRPVIKIDSAGKKSLTWPSVKVSYAEYDPENNLALGFVEGVEPSRNWRNFATDFINQLDDIAGIIFVGALLADTPHTRPTPVHMTSDDPDIQNQTGLSASKYEGPVGIMSVLAEPLEKMGIPTISMWASVPHYAHGSPCPVAALSLVKELSIMLTTEVDTAELEHQVAIWTHNVSEQVDQDLELRGYVEQLEKIYDTEETYVGSGDQIAEEFEKYLRNSEDEGEGDEA